MSCSFCDTPASVANVNGEGAQEYCSIQISHKLCAVRDRISNPVSAARLSELCLGLAVPGPAVPVISLTGGEPLLQHEFLATWLPQVRGKFRILLETNGVHADAMKALQSLIDVVAMDFKMPSATGLRAFWEEHRQFLLAAGKVDLFVKAVVTPATQREDILTAARLIAEINCSIPLVIQPVNDILKSDPQILLDFQDIALGIINNVRVIPQVHKILNVP